MARSWASDAIAASATTVDPAGVNRAATIAATVEAPGPHASSTAAKTATTATATGVGIIGDERGGEKNEGRNSCEKITKHG
jgi:hypothetical protein